MLLHLPAVRSFISAVLVAVIAGVAPAQSPKRDAPPSPAEALRAVAADLKEARGLLKGVADRPTRDRLELLITRSELAAAELAKAADKDLKPAGMAAADFEKVMKGLTANAFDDGKLTFVRSLGNTARFTSAQAKDMLAAFTFDPGRVKAALLLHPLVADPELFFQTFDAFVFESSKREVREKLGLR